MKICSKFVEVLFSSGVRISNAFATGQAFFNLPENKKLIYSRNTNYEQEGDSGYVAPNLEILDPKNAAELRESFNYVPRDHFKISVDAVVPKFHSTLDTFSNLCFDVALNVLRVFAINLNLEDTEFFTKCHRRDVSTNMLRLLNYPPLPETVSPGSVRCGEHTDYGSMTLLFQDNVGGLEVLGRDNRFIQAEPVPGAVLINTGDLMQRWTSDRLVATRHRVLIPENRQSWLSHRTSIAYFVHPDDDYVIETLDGSKKYPSVNVHNYLDELYRKTYY